MQAILDLAEEQYGLFTAAQWKQAGLSRRALRRKEAVGAVEEVHPGVFAVAGAPRTLENELLDWWILRFTFDDVHRWPEETAELVERTIAKRCRSGHAAPAA